MTTAFWGLQDELAHGKVANPLPMYWPTLTRNSSQCLCKQGCVLKLHLSNCIAKSRSEGLRRNSKRPGVEGKEYLGSGWHLEEPEEKSNKRRKVHLSESRIRKVDRPSRTSWRLVAATLGHGDARKENTLFNKGQLFLLYDLRLICLSRCGPTEVTRILGGLECYRHPPRPEK